MSAGKELFKLFGLIGMQGMEEVQKDLKKVDKQARKTQKEIDRMGRRFQNVGKVLTKVFTLPMIAAAAASVKFIDDATDLNETVAKTGEIFGDSAKDIEKWAETSATKLGQNKAQAMDAAATFAMFGQNAGLAGKELTTFSTDFVELASDMASFFNTEPDQAITAIGAAFRGETEPIRKYGIMLDDATMRQKAFELGIVTSTKKALMPQTKILAAQALIMDQSKTAQGDFARTSAGLANQKRILNAQLKNVSATLGQLFLPAALDVGKAIARLVGLLERLIDLWKDLEPRTKKTIKGFVLIAAAVGPVAFALGKIIALSKILIPLLVGLKTGTLGLASAMVILKSAMGITLIITALVAAGWYLYSNWESISIKLKVLWANIKVILTKSAAGLWQAFADVTLAGVRMVNKLSKFIPGLESKLKGVTVGLLKFKAGLIEDVDAAEKNLKVVEEQAEAYNKLAEQQKKATESTKESTTTKEENTKKTQKQIEAEKEAARLAEENAKKAADREKERVAHNKAIWQQINELTMTRAQLLEVEKQEAIRIANEKGADVFAVETLYIIKEQELKDQMRKEEEAKNKKAIKGRLSMASSMGNKLNSILAKFSDNKLKRLDIEEKKQIATINASQMTEEEKDAAIQRIQDETEKKRRKMERERAVREKAAAIFQIAINTAAAVVEALPNYPLAIATGIFGAAEAVAVASQPLPFYDGGLIQGSKQGVNALVGESDQDELVFPLERGIDLLVDGLVERLSNIELPKLELPALAGAGAGGNISLNAGVLVADERGLKELERRLDTIRISENQRKGF